MHNDHAFPLNEESYYDEIKIGTTYHEGLTKREYFAAAALQGFCANTSFSGECAQVLAKGAVLQADALIAELNKNEHGIDELREAAEADRP